MFKHLSIGYKRQILFCTSLKILAIAKAMSAFFALSKIKFSCFRSIIKIYTNSKINSLFGKKQTIKYLT